MASSPVFISDRSQAVRLPKAVALADDVAQVDVVQISHNRMVVPRGGRWDDPLLDGLRVSEDFLAEREQPAAEMREPL